MNNYKNDILKCESDDELRGYISNNFMKDVKLFNETISDISEEYKTRYFIEIYNEVLSDIDTKLDSGDFIEFEYGYNVIGEKESYFYKEMIDSSYMDEQKQHILLELKQRLYLPNKSLHNLLGEDLFMNYIEILKN